MRKNVEQPVPDDAFQQGLMQHQALVEGSPVPKGAFIDSVNELEAAGMQLMGEGSAQQKRVATALHTVFSAASELNIQPPLSTEQTQGYVGKVIVFKALMETGTRSRKDKPTDTNAIPTDKPKR